MIVVAQRGIFGTPGFHSRLSCLFKSSVGFRRYAWSIIYYLASQNIPARKTELQWHLHLFPIPLCKFWKQSFTLHRLLEMKITNKIAEVVFCAIAHQDAGFEILPSPAVR